MSFVRVGARQGSQSSSTGANGGLGVATTSTSSPSALLRLDLTVGSSLSLLVSFFHIRFRSPNYADALSLL
jgi:hypothetical protein